MSRPSYETVNDLAAENLIIQSFCAQFQVEARKRPKYDLFDYVIVGGQPVAAVGLAEVKRRRFPAARHMEIMLSAVKYQRAVDASQIARVPFLFIVGFSDTCGVWRLRDGKPEPAIRQRFGRVSITRDEQDIEDVRMIPVSDFRLFPWL